MKSLTIAAMNLRRFMRERANIFFVFIFPMLLILVLGSVFGGGFDTRLGVVALGSGELTSTTVDSLEARGEFVVQRAERPRRRHTGRRTRRAGGGVDHPRLTTTTPCARAAAWRSTSSPARVSRPRTFAGPSTRCSPIGWRCRASPHSSPAKERARSTMRSPRAEEAAAQAGGVQVTTTVSGKPIVFRSVRAVRPGRATKPGPCSCSSRRWPGRPR